LYSLGRGKDVVLDGQECVRVRGFTSPAGWLMEEEGHSLHRVRATCVLRIHFHRNKSIGRWIAAVGIRVRWCALKRRERLL